MLYGIDQNEIEDINIRHCNYKYFKDVRLEENIIASPPSLNDIIKDADYLLNIIATQYVINVFEQVKPFLKKKIIVINASMEFDINTNMRMSDTIRSVLVENATLQETITSLMSIVLKAE